MVYLGSTQGYPTNAILWVRDDIDVHTVRISSLTTAICRACAASYNDHDFLICQSIHVQSAPLRTQGRLVKLSQLNATQVKPPRWQAV